MMKIKKTQRGFSYYEFKDNRKELCTLQESSNAEEECIWLGASKLVVSIGYPWEDITEETIKQAFGASSIVSNQRMELSRNQVKKLLPILQKFVETGEI